jgi:hypothetical protein
MVQKMTKNFGLPTIVGEREGWREAGMVAETG